MGLLTYIKDRVRSILVPIGGVISTPTDNETYPTHISNEGLGGPFTARTLEEMAQIPIERLTPGSLCTVMQHVRPDDSIFKRTRYVFDPAEDDWNSLLSSGELRIIDIENYDISQYWKIDAEIGGYQGELESQYAPAYDYGNPGGPERPYFQEPLITKERYQQGFPDNESLETIWKEEYDPSCMYERQRFGSNSDWGIPVQITSESYVAGDYIDNIFIWVAKGETPQTPRSLVDGKANLMPAGWSKTPATPGGQNYYDYIETYDLFKSSSTKDVFGITLRSPWSKPRKISTDPQLVRYGNNPGSTNYINPDGSDTADWRGYYTPGQDTHMAIRLSVNSSWRVEMIDNEEGEYVDYIFKLFPVGHEIVEADRPTLSRPFLPDQNPDGSYNYPNNGWRDSPPSSIPADKFMAMSSGRKFNNGYLKPSGWSFPIRMDGLDVTQVVIEPSDTAFKYKAETISPSTIELKAIFTKGGEPIIPTEPIKWYKGDVAQENEIIKGSSVGVSQHHTISGDNNEILTINPNGVSNKQTYNVRAVFGGKAYFDSQTIIDVTDGIGIVAIIESDSGFAFKNGQGEKTFTARLYENGHEITSGLSYSWDLNGEDVTPGSNPKELTITGEQVDNQEVLKLDITRSGIVYSRTETVVDLHDADLPLFQFSLDGEVWSSNPENAIYMRVSTDNGQSWSDSIKVKGEEAPWNGGFEKNAYINHPTKPVATGVQTNLLPNPIGGKSWTDSPTEPDNPETEDTWQVKTFFQKKQYNPDGSLNKNIEHTLANWSIVGSWSTAVKINARDGEGSAVPGPKGFPGWIPVLSLFSYLDGVVVRIANWTNPDPEATGKPATGMFLGSSGLVGSPANAVNIRGPQGIKGDAGKNGVANGLTAVLTTNGSTPTNLTESFQIAATIDCQEYIGKRLLVTAHSTFYGDASDFAKSGIYTSSTSSIGFPESLTENLMETENAREVVNVALITNLQRRYVRACVASRRQSSLGLKHQNTILKVEVLN